MPERLRFKIAGRVQGVGFRPAIYRLATSLGLTGWVRNTVQGVVVEVEGENAELDEFKTRLPLSYPPMAKVSALAVEALPAEHSQTFTVDPSTRSGEVSTGMPPDIATCPDCIKELRDPQNKRFAYPFINCTNCGPRFTIISALPYDRPLTSMHDFALCPDCARDYADPLDRRFEAQPIACPDCGPVLQLLDGHGAVISPADPLGGLIAALNQGRIAAIKGLGGFHLCCEAGNEQAITRLRTRKHRPHKALAVMFRSLEELLTYCEAGPLEQELLTSPAAPIVLLQRAPGCPLPQSIAPDTNTIGAFLPYTPLHHLLLSQISPLIMTSANISDEPMAMTEPDLHGLLGPIADLALIHNRPILRRADDSVMAVRGNAPVMLRRSRGIVPEPLLLPFSGPSVLACGSDMKNTFALTKANQVVLSQYIGDLADRHTKLFYQQQIGDLKHLLQVTPALVVHDLHPGYVSSTLASTLAEAPLLAVQHHHAHLAACMAEHQLTQPVIGLILDGTGYGSDSHLWGGEVLVGDYTGFTRPLHFEEVPLPGLEQAILHPSRMAYAYLFSVFGPEDALSYGQHWLPALSSEEMDLLNQMLTHGVRSPLTSSAGRLFDAVAALLGFDNPVTYEGQAAVRLEALAKSTVLQEHYTFELHHDRISFKSMLAGLVSDLQHHLAKERIAAKFHSTVVQALLAAALRVREETGLEDVILSGGVFQNKVVLEAGLNTLGRAGFKVYTHHQVPTHDGGLALGQAAIGMAKLQP